jgi:hypothetical protein
MLCNKFTILPMFLNLLLPNLSKLPNNGMSVFVDLCSAIIHPKCYNGYGGDGQKDCEDCVRAEPYHFAGVTDLLHS